MRSVVPKEHNQYVNRKQVIAENNFKLSKFNNVESKVKPMFEGDKKKRKGEKGEEERKEGEE